MTEREHWNREFAARFVRREDELKWLYCELYHNDMQAYRYFCGMLYRAYEARPESLKMMDRARGIPRMVPRARSCRHADVCQCVRGEPERRTG